MVLPQNLEEKAVHNLKALQNQDQDPDQEIKGLLEKKFKNLPKGQRNHLKKKLKMMIMTVTW